MKHLFSNATIVTCDDGDTVFENCDLLVDGSRITRIEPGISDESATRIDCTGKVIYPGLINTHHHFFQTFVRNRMSIDYPSLSVMEWLDRIYPIFASMDEDIMYYASLTAMADLVKHGCTTAFDHQYNHTKDHGTHMIDRQVEAAGQIGIRYVGGRGANTVPMSEGSPIPPQMLETTDGFLADCERLVGAYHDPDPFAMVQIVVAPCQPINCHPETFVESARLARKLGVRLHTHLGEGENEGMVARYGMRTLDWCEQHEFIGDDVWYAHCWELTPGEFEKMGRYGTGVSHCPAPAVLGGFPILDIEAIQEMNVPVSLGCDGSSTNDSSNLLDSLRLAYLMQAWHTKQRGGAITPYELLRIATRGGADTLGRPELGQLGVDRAADLFVLDLNRLEWVGTTHDPLNLIPKAGYTGQVDLTMVNGEIVYADGQLTQIDEDELTARAIASHEKIERLF